MTQTTHTRDDVSGSLLALQPQLQFHAATLAVFNCKEVELERQFGYEATRTCTCN